MSNIFKKTALLSSIIAASAMTSVAHAEDLVSGITVTPTIGYTAPDNNRDLDDNRVFGLTLGYQFESPWALEFSYLNMDSELSSGQDVDAEQFRLDGLYHFVNDSKVTPYVAAGFGKTNYSMNLDGDGNDQLNVGGGIKYAVKENVALRADYRLVDDLETDHLDQIATLGLQFTFGAKKPAPVVAAPAPVVKKAEPKPAPAPAPVPVKTVLPYDINFAFDSSKVAQSEYADLQSIAEYLAAHPKEVAQIRGYADATGSDAYNNKLSVKRAKAVAKLLVEKFGVDPKRLDTVGFGENYPVADNKTKANRAKNRRATTISFISREAMAADMPKAK